MTPMLFGKRDFKLNFFFSSEKDESFTMKSLSKLYSDDGAEFGEKN